MFLVGFKPQGVHFYRIGEIVCYKISLRTLYRMSGTFGGH